MRTYRSDTGLPRLIATKIYKTGQTRGAEKDTIYQNRVLRNGTVLIPLSSWNNGEVIPPGGFENGYIVLARPSEYFSSEPPKPRPELPTNLILGENLLICYETREEWREYNPEKFGWQPAKSRTRPLKGQYIARLPDTTSPGDVAIRDGFADSQSGGQGAGVRVYEYASRKTINNTRYQLAYLAWRTDGIIDLAKEEGEKEPEECKGHVDDYCGRHGLADISRLEKQRVLRNGKTVCPLCLKPVTALELASRVQQAEGRFVPDLTVTSANLFHIKALVTGEYNHNEYNVGWAHYHCNTVARDLGVERTLEWMKTVLEENGFSVTPSSTR